MRRHSLLLAFEKREEYEEIFDMADEPTNYRP